MEDTNTPEPYVPTLEEQKENAYRSRQRELRIARARASIVRLQITEAYEIIERIRFDYLGDTAFRDKVTRAKSGLESALDDFLLDDHYWKERKDVHNKLTPEEYWSGLNDNSSPMSSVKE